MSDNECILLTKRLPNDRNASLKAPEDIEKIFSRSFGKTYRLYNSEKKIIKNVQCLITFLRLRCRSLLFKKSEILVVQTPLYPRKPFDELLPFRIGYKKKIAIIHDLDSLRFFPEDMEVKSKEIESLLGFDAIICHNDIMKSWLNNSGVNAPIIPLNIFDYLCKKEKLDIPKTINEYTISFAGNLKKSIFLQNISSTISHSLFLYGNKPDYKLGENTYYEGSYPADELPLILKGEFGLIWDGEGTNTCSGLNGNYMRYNNPHKLSLYIASGIPVITWKEAAIADFIIKNDIGIVVESLSEIDEKLDSLSLERYNEILDNVCKIQEKVVNGCMIKNAIREAIEIIR